MAVLVIAVCGAVLAVHWPALSAKAFSFDDGLYFTGNSLVQNPSWASARRFFAEALEPSTVGGYYQPLTMISLMTDYALGGRENNLTPFHRTSLSLHAANTALIIVLLYMLFGQVWTAAAVGLLFGVHPLTVEPIPWVSERKTLLAAFFALWSLILYVRHAHRNDWRVYAGCFVTYVLALMSKPTSLPLPALMLLMDYWPLNRWRRKRVAEKLPFFVVGGVFAVITYISQKRTSFIALPGQYNPAHIPLTICHNIIFYLYKIIWPANLSSYYPFPKPLGLSNPTVLACVVGSCILIGLLVVSLRWTRGLLTGWLFFFMAILPTMQIIRFSHVIASDKFAYLPSVGLLMILASFSGRLFQSGKPAVRQAVLIIAVILAGAESVATRQYLAQWRDTVTLYEYMLRLTPDLAPLHANLGAGFKSEGKLDEAISHFRQAIQLDPYDAESHYNLANALQLQGKLDEAISLYHKALRIKPNFAEAHNGLGIAMAAQGKLDEAISHYRQALQLKPDLPEAHYNLGLALKSQGKLDEAISNYRQELQLMPYSVKAHNNLAIALQLRGRPDEAISHYRQALRIEPDSAEIYINMGNALRLQGKLDEAISQYREALRINPNLAKAHNNLGTAISLQGNIDEGISHLFQALQLKPDYADAHFNLGCILQAEGRLDEAISHYRRAIEIDPNYTKANQKLQLLYEKTVNPK